MINIDTGLYLTLPMLDAVSHSSQGRSTSSLLTHLLYPTIPYSACRREHTLLYHARHGNRKPLHRWNGSPNTSTKHSYKANLSPPPALSNAMQCDAMSPHFYSHFVRSLVYLNLICNPRLHCTMAREGKTFPDMIDIPPPW